MRAIPRFLPCFAVLGILSSMSAAPFGAQRASAAESCLSGDTSPDDPPPCGDPAADARRFPWPAIGRIVLGCRPASGGIDLALPAGAPVRAIDAGRVAYVGRVGGYSNVALVRHPNGFVSAYANVVDNKLRRGDRVARGEIIGAAGEGPAAPLLHFELRKDGIAVDPRKYLACR